MSMVVLKSTATAYSVGSESWFARFFKTESPKMLPW